MSGLPHTGLPLEAPLSSPRPYRPGLLCHSVSNKEVEGVNLLGLYPFSLADFRSGQ